MSIDRRDFLVSIGAAATGATILGCREKPASGPAPAPSGVSEANLNWSKAPCRFCGVGCGVEVGVHEGKVLAVRGDVASPVNRGLLCVKGYHLPAILYARDRLLHPMKRRADGKGFDRIS